MQFRILGPIQALLDDDQPAALGAPKQRGLLALLLVNRRRVVPADQLIDGLWGESPPASAVQSLQVYVHGLRRALGSERIETAGRGYRVVVGEDETFQGGQEWLARHGVEIVVLGDSECVAMMKEFIAANPELWNEDIGEPS